MLKFSASNTTSGRPVLGIGLSRENCERLLQGQPIAFDTSTMDGLPDIEVFLMAGEDEATMAMDMVREGALVQDQIVEDRTLADENIQPLDISEEVN
jgi:hypothetical protein